MKEARKANNAKQSINIKIKSAALIRQNKIEKEINYFKVNFKI